MSQIALPLTLRTSADPGRIVIGNANRTAHEALGMPQDWPFRTAVLTGPSRSGKTLFGRWAEGRGIKVVDGADRVEEAELFHRWNAAQEASHPLLLISDSSEEPTSDLQSLMRNSYAVLCLKKKQKQTLANITH